MTTTPASWLTMAPSVALSTTRTRLSGVASTTTPSGTRGVWIQNLSTTINIYLGGSDVTNTGGGNLLCLLSPLQIMEIDIANPNLLYAVAASGTPSIVCSVMG